MADALEQAGFSLEPETGEIMGIRQSSFKLNPAVSTLGRRAEEGRIQIGDSRLMRWSAGNVTATDRGHLVEIGRRSDNGKIDVIAALLDAASCLVLRRPKAEFDVRTLIG